MLKYEVIRSPARFLGVDTKKLQEHINSLVAEKSYILYGRKLTLGEEKKWQVAKAGEIRKKVFIPVICWDGERIAGISNARRGAFNEAHNALFGLSVAASYRRRGVGTKLLRLAMAEARQTLKAKSLWIEHIDGNNVARSLYLKAGFAECARLAGYVKHRGSLRDKVIMKYSKKR